MSLLHLILAFFKIGVLSFGGGWTVVGLIQHEVIQNGWMTDLEFSQIVSIAQVTPGPVALNTATMVGFQNFGYLGAVLATLSVCAFPMIGITLLIFVSAKIESHRGRIIRALQGATLAMVAMTAVNLSVSSTVSPMTFIIAGASLLLSIFTKISPLILIFASGIIGGIIEVMVIL
ncbi:MAG: chromate transporter [Treponema sp.]|jgi:chromate transporter|nr:chromate transporter [Treponema sp.]